MPAIAISATFLNGTYHGVEWPPSPARLVQALVAGVSAGACRDLRPSIDPALEWLERQRAPEILAVRPRDGQPYRLAVPNNDMDVIAHEWASGRAANPATLRTMKTLQPRYLDMNGPHVRYIWPAADPEAAGVAGQLAILAGRLHTFGWGVDMACAGSELVDTAASAGLERWLPARSGIALAVPVPGFLEDLDSTYERFRRRTRGQAADADTRPSVFRMQRYAPERERRAHSLTFALLSADGRQSHAAPWGSAMIVAARMRHAAGEVLAAEGFDREFLDSYVLGHAGADEDWRRMSFVPLPTVVPGDDRRADGRIRRAMFVEPPDGDGTALRILRAALPGYAARDTDTKEAAFIFSELPEKDAVTALYLCLAPAPMFRQEAAAPPQTLSVPNLRPQLAAPRGACVWRSVTPVLLHGYNTANGKLSLKKTDRMLFRAFEMAGFAVDSVESIAFQAAPFWHGCGSALQIDRPAHLQRLPRYHVEVRFREPVMGPVLAGIGRHCGLGVFAAAG